MSPLTLHLVYGLPTFVVTPLADGIVNSIGLGPLYLGQVGHICWMAKAKSSTGCGSLSYPTPNRALLDSDLSDLKASSSKSLLRDAVSDPCVQRHRLVRL